MISFEISNKYRRVYVGHTRKTPVELVNIFFAQPKLHPSSNNRRSHTNRCQRFKYNFSTHFSLTHCTSIDAVIDI